MRDLDAAIQHDAELAADFLAQDGSALLFAKWDDLAGRLVT